MQTQAQELPLVMKTVDVMKVLGMSKVKVYEIIHQKGFPLMRFGRSIRIPREPFLRWLEEQAGE